MTTTINAQAFYDTREKTDHATTVGLTRWIGYEGGEWQRVQRAFVLAGFLPPHADTPTGRGAYVANIVNQYEQDLDRDACLALITDGLAHTLKELDAWRPGDWADRHGS